MAKFLDLTGKRFSKWKVLCWVQKKYQEQFWLCECDCGTSKVVAGGSLKKGVSKSCGCSGKEWCTTHGMVGTSIYNIWAGMIQRCDNPKARGYENYGGRGIKVCKEWKESFDAFYKDMGERPDGLSLDRKDNNGDYTKDNCRWATGKQQGRNKRSNVIVMFNGEQISVAELAERTGTDRKTVERRIRRGWSVEKAISLDKFGRWGKINQATDQL